MTDHERLLQAVLRKRDSEIEHLRSLVRDMRDTMAAMRAAADMKDCARCQSVKRISERFFS